MGMGGDARDKNMMGEARMKREARAAKRAQADFTERRMARKQEDGASAMLANNAPGSAANAGMAGQATDANDMLIDMKPMRAAQRRYQKTRATNMPASTVIGPK